MNIEAPAFKPVFGVSKVRPKDREVVLKDLCGRCNFFLDESHALEFVVGILLESGVNDLHCEPVMEPENEYAGVRFFWNFSKRANGGNPQATCDSIEIGIHSMALTISLVQAGEKGVKEGRKIKPAKQNVEYLDRRTWLQYPELLRQAVKRAIENPQQVKSPNYSG